MLLLKELNWLLTKWIRLRLPLAEWVVLHVFGGASHSPAFVVVYFCRGNLTSPFMKSNSEPPRLAGKSLSGESVDQVASPLRFLEVWLPSGSTGFASPRSLLCHHSPSHASALLGPCPASWEVARQRGAYSGLVWRDIGSYSVLSFWSSCWSFSPYFSF